MVDGSVSGRLGYAHECAYCCWSYELIEMGPLSLSFCVRLSDEFVCKRENVMSDVLERSYRSGDREKGRIRIVGGCIRSRRYDIVIASCCCILFMDICVCIGMLDMRC